MKRRAWALIVSLAGGCAEEPTAADPKQVIVLDLEGGWSRDERQAVENAANTWNLEFGTRVRIAEFGDDENRVPLSFTDDACSNTRGQATHARATSVPPAIFICPRTAEDLVLLFETVRHELGHILGIPVHASDSLAVMTGRATNLVHWFRDEDRDLFFGANQGFAGQTGCLVSPWIAGGVPMLAQPVDQPVHLIWAKRETIRYAPISKLGLLGEEAGSFDTTLTPARLGAHATPEGFLLSWFEENRLNLSSIVLPQEASEPRTVELEWPATSIYHVSEQYTAPYYWLALTIRETDANAPRTLHLHQFDATSGRLIHKVPLAMSHGMLVIHEGQPFLISGQLDEGAQVNRVRVERIQPRADGFDLIEALEVAAIPYVTTQEGATPEPLLAAQSTNGGIVMLLETSVGSIDLVRVSTQSGLAVEKSFTIHASELSDPVILESYGRVFIGASMHGPTHYEKELYLLQLAPDSLEVTDPWRMLSAADTSPAVEPRLAVSGNNVVAVWSEPSGDVRSRCVRLE